ncbi:MAG: lipoyl(octanoyl) transferase LipB [Chitinophagaceae bacterium]
MKQTVQFQDLKQASYKEVWDYQETLLQQNVQIKQQARDANVDAKFSNTTHHLLFVEHPPVYTLGKNGNENNVLLTPTELQEKNIEYFHINRGGDITFHGPGQIVGYPIFDLDKFSTDLGWYLRSLEEVIIKTLAHYGLHGMRSKGETGVWLDANELGKERKICAIGIKCSRWITMHGFAFNVNTNLDYFKNIIPCGIVNKKVTSLQQELQKEIDLNEVKQIVKHNFEEVFNITLTQSL